MLSTNKEIQIKVR